LTRHLAARPERTEEDCLAQSQQALRAQRHFEENQD